MTVGCTRCDGTGFLNIEQVPDADKMEIDETLQWMKANSEHDVTVCDCCGDGSDWYGTPGEHYGSFDPGGHRGPYDYNGGLCECH